MQIDEKARQAVARALHQREMERALRAQRVMSEASGKPCTGILEEPFEEHADMWLGDADAAITAYLSAAEGGKQEAVAWEHTSERTGYETRVVLSRYEKNPFLGPLTPMRPEWTYSKRPLYTSPPPADRDAPASMDEVIERCAAEAETRAQEQRRLMVEVARTKDGRTKHRIHAEAMEKFAEALRALKTGGGDERG